MVSDFSFVDKCNNALAHSLEWMRLWGCTPGWIGEESVDGFNFNKLFDAILARYRNHRGCLAVTFVENQGLHRLCNAMSVLSFATYGVLNEI